jgi:hypothetical protein
VTLQANEGFRFDDTRYQAIAELADSKASDRTIMEIAGRVSNKLLQHRARVWLEARPNAPDALTMKRESKAMQGAQRMVTTQTTTKM